MKNITIRYSYLIIESKEIKHIYRSLSTIECEGYSYPINEKVKLLGRELDTCVVDIDKMPIYENDVLQCTCDIGRSKQNYGRVYRVKYHNGGFKFIANNDELNMIKRMLNPGAVYNLKLKVVGYSSDPELTDTLTKRGCERIIPVIKTPVEYPECTETNFHEIN